MAFALHTNAFPANGEIPTQYTCSGADISPQLAWTEIPAGTQSLALIVDDPDAPRGTFTHWVLYNLAPQTTELQEELPKTGQLPGGALQGQNDFRRVGYSGPCPPPGKPHHYFFKLYALDRQLNLKPGATKNEVEGAMKGHILSEARLMGSFRR